MRVRGVMDLRTDGQTLSYRCEIASNSAPSPHLRHFLVREDVVEPIRRDATNFAAFDGSLVRVRLLSVTQQMRHRVRIESLVRLGAADLRHRGSGVAGSGVTGSSVFGSGWI